ncbi:4'-phosphopantetheinyl transferase family protein [Chakrabartyella piscis]|uniref:4'-phosphopantetheinyl transferase family protein n=1 Tax=Chakrabartyella piscis TaxID=2918914 RepID=UPI00295854BF|nr:4'-phosphopantetheinyl transferase superfamily protein [Chakrabartyella piscis]
MKAYILDVTQLNKEEIFDEALSHVKKTRQDKVALLRKKEVKRTSLGAGLLLEYALQQEDASYDVETLAYTPKGKPYFLGNDIYFNISHSGEVVLCVTSQKNIGCDIEKIRETIPKHLDKILSKTEMKCFETLSETEKKKYFFQLWTAKESIAKWNGAGLAFPFAEITVMDTNEVKSSIIYEETVVYLQSGQENDYMWTICSEEKPHEIRLNHKKILDIL